MKLKWTKDYVLASAGTENEVDNSDNIISFIKETTSYIPVDTLTSKDKNYQNFLAKDLKDHCIGTNIKQNVRLKTRQTSIHIFLNQVW